MSLRVASVVGIVNSRRRIRLGSRRRAGSSGVKGEQLGPHGQVGREHHRCASDPVVVEAVQEAGSAGRVLAIRSSHLARRRWRSWRSASCPRTALVTKAMLLDDGTSGGLGRPDGPRVGGGSVKGGMGDVAGRVAPWCLFGFFGWRISTRAAPPSRLPRRLTGARQDWVPGEEPRQAAWPR